MYLDLSKHQRGHGLCFWKLINHQNDTDHSFTGFKLSGFQLKQETSNVPLLLLDV